MADDGTDEIEWRLTLRDLATPEYRKAVQESRALSREVTDNINRQDAAYNRLCKTIIKYRQLSDLAPLEARQKSYKVSLAESVKWQLEWAKATGASAERVKELTKRLEELNRANNPFAGTMAKATQEVRKGQAAITGFSTSARLAVSSLGRLPGPIGQVGRSFGYLTLAAKGFLGPVGAVIAAFTTAYTLTSKLVEKMGWFRSEFSKTLQSNKAARIETEQLTEAFNEQRDAWVAALEAEAQHTDKAIAKIDKMAAAYLRLQNARKAVADAMNNRELLGMERAKYEDMLTAGGQYGSYIDNEGRVRVGDGVAAAQVGAYHDILIAQRRQAIEREAADAGLDSAERDVRRLEEGLNRARISERRINGQSGASVENIARLQEKLEDLDRARKAATERMKSGARDALPEDFKNLAASVRNMEDQYRKAKAEYDAEMSRAKSFERQKEKARERREALTGELDAAKSGLDAARINRDALSDRQALDMARLEDQYNKIILEEQRREQEAWEEELRQRAEAERAANAETERQRHQMRLQYAQDELTAARAAEAGAQTRLAAAQSQVARAWGWYKNPESMAAYAQAQNEDAAAREQYRKDYWSLSHGRKSALLAEAISAQANGGPERVEELFTDWRQRKRLSVNEEATMRVALAEREESEARRSLVEIADNTRNLAEKLDELASMKED